MTIRGLSQHDLGERLNAVLSPSHPIRSIEHLRGRDDELQRIERALYADGRNVFIYGDRGVGKSSLAATAAAQYQSADAPPISVGAAHDDTFPSIVASIAHKALGRSRLESEKRTESSGFEWRGLKASDGREITPLEIASRIQTVGDGAEVLAEIAKRHSAKPIVVIDEFDTIASISERNKFAHLLKHLGDQGTNIKVIFTGVGTSLDELLGAHDSAHRQLEQVELNRLPYLARKEIVKEAAEAFDLTVNDDVNWRIAIVSDGFPYYVHLIMERMLWEAFADSEEISELTWPHYHGGLRTAIASINAQLKRPYEKAVLQRPEFMEDVVWSTADGDDLHFPTARLFESYRVIAKKRERVELLERDRFTEQIRKLKGDAFGGVLVSMEGRSGWYTYRERMLRGFVRMQAEGQGIELSGEREAPRQRMHVSASLRTGIKGPSLPPGVRSNAPIRKKD